MDERDHVPGRITLTSDGWTRLEEEDGRVLYSPPGERTSRDEDDPRAVQNPERGVWPEGGPERGPGSGADSEPAPWPDFGHDTGRDGYRRASDEVWAMARRDYLAGDSAETVCARHGLRPGTLRHRAAAEGWRRMDQPDPEPVDLDAETAAGLPDPADMARHALIRMNRAVLRGRASEAASWMRLYEKLTALSGAAKPAPQSRKSEPRPPPDPEAARQAALDDALVRRAAGIERLARDLMTLDPRDPAARAAFEARLTALDRPAPEGPDSDHSDHSDPVFPPPGSESAPGGDPG